MSKVVRPARERAGSPNEGRLRGLAEPAYAGFLCRTCPFTGQGNAPKLGSSDFAHARQGCYSECAVPRTPLPAKVRRFMMALSRLCIVLRPLAQTHGIYNSPMIELEDLLNLGGRLHGPARVERFTDWSYDSRLTKAGQLFIVLRTPRADGHDYIADALLAGATGLLCSYPPAWPWRRNPDRR